MMVNEAKTIRELAEDFILYKQEIGYSYQGPSELLRRFICFVEQMDISAVYPDKRIVELYMDRLTNSPGTLYGVTAVLREFSRYLINRGYKEAYLIPPKSCSQPVSDPPYFFTEKECSMFFEVLDKIERHSSFRGREIVIPALFRMIYCCGLRCKEVRVLRCEHVHLADGYFDIIQSKGPKSRRIFISDALVDYLQNYDMEIALLFPEREYFFQSNRGHYSSNAVSGNFRRFWQKAFPDFKLTNRPRAYDFRHHFAWANLNRWAAEGLDINVMLPYLMRYMGHQTVKETLYYFHFVPEFFPTFGTMACGTQSILPEVPDDER